MAAHVHILVLEIGLVCQEFEEESEELTHSARVVSRCGVRVGGEEAPARHDHVHVLVLQVSCQKKVLLSIKNVACVGELLF